jgi:hypothetical protein
MNTPWHGHRKRLGKLLLDTMARTLNRKYGRRHLTKEDALRTEPGGQVHPQGAWDGGAATQPEPQSSGEVV